MKIFLHVCSLSIFYALQSLNDWYDNNLTNSKVYQLRWCAEFVFTLTAEARIDHKICSPYMKKYLLYCILVYSTL